MFSVSCTTFQHPTSRFLQKRRIRCEVLSDVRMITELTTPLTHSSSVTIKILDTQSAGEEKLVLMGKPTRDYDGPEDGDVWLPIGTVVEINVLYNTQSGIYFLRPEVKRKDVMARGPGLAGDPEKSWRHTMWKDPKKNEKEIRKSQKEKRTEERKKAENGGGSGNKGSIRVLLTFFGRGNKGAIRA